MSEIAKFRVVTKISSCQVNTTSRRGIKRLGIFVLFSNKSSRGPLSEYLQLLMTTLLSLKVICLKRAKILYSFEKIY